MLAPVAVLKSALSSIQEGTPREGGSVNLVRRHSRFSSKISCSCPMKTDFLKQHIPEETIKEMRELACTLRDMMRSVISRREAAEADLEKVDIHFSHLFI
jgi:hypothetical protein